MEFAVVAGAARPQARRAAPAGAAGRHEQRDFFPQGHFVTFGPTVGPVPPAVGFFLRVTFCNIWSHSGTSPTGGKGGLGGLVKSLDFPTQFDVVVAKSDDGNIVSDDRI